MKKFVDDFKTIAPKRPKSIDMGAKEEEEVKVEEEKVEEVKEEKEEVKLEKKMEEVKEEKEEVKLEEKKMETAEVSNEEVPTDESSNDKESAKETPVDITEVENIEEELYSCLLHHSSHTYFIFIMDTSDDKNNSQHTSGTEYCWVMSFLDLDSESSYSDEDKSEEIQKQVEELKQQLQANPKDKEGYDKIIELYRSLGEIDDLRAIRLQYKQNYPLSPGFIYLLLFILEIWIQWISDEIQLVSSDEDKDSICHLFQASLKDYYSIDLWIHYLNYVNTYLPSEMSTTVEEALKSCTADCIEGLRLWVIVLEWSKTTQEQQITESYFLRMLSNPYESIQAAYDQYKEWHESIGVEVGVSHFLDYR